jgi:hypothetical protein
MGFPDAGSKNSHWCVVYLTFVYFVLRLLPLPLQLLYTSWITLARLNSSHRTTIITSAPFGHSDVLFSLTVSVNTSSCSTWNFTIFRAYRPCSETILWLPNTKGTPLTFMGALGAPYNSVCTLSHFFAFFSTFWPTKQIKPMICDSQQSYWDP